VSAPRREHGRKCHRLPCTTIALIAGTVLSESHCGCLAHTIEYGSPIVQQLQATVPDHEAHQQKTFPSGRNGSVRVDALRQSHQRHPGGGLLRTRRQYHASRCTSPSDRSFAVSSSDSARAFSDAPERTCSYGGAFRTLRDLTIRIVKFWSSWDRCAALRETWCRILKAVVLRVP